MTRAFSDWKARADSADLLQTAILYGAKLKRKGHEWVGPCPACGGTDRFAVNVVKVKWNCRGSEGGRGPIGLVQHVRGVSFLRAIEELTGEPNPNGGTGPLTPYQETERLRRAEWLAKTAQQRRDQQQTHETNTRAAARAIWDGSGPIAGTLAEKYLNSRGIPTPDKWPDVMRFHGALIYPGRAGNVPTMVCRVDDIDGNLTSVWRIFLRGDARKLDVQSPKLGLGPAGGGAVRLGGIGPKIGVCEGIETAYGYWLLTGQKYPVWAALSTSGLVAVELPLCVEHVCVVPDGDRPIKKKDGEYIPAVPAGRKAAQTLRARLLAEGVGVTIAPEPGAKKDYSDLWLERTREVA